MKPSNHTPIPWEVSAVNENGVVGTQWNGSITPLAVPVIPAWHEDRRKGSEEADANAAFIVRAVNSHNDLLVIAKDALCELDPDCKYDGVKWLDGMDDRESLIIGLYEAIAKGEGK